MKTKKALSDIVSTVLIIMIAVAAVGIIGAVVIPMVKNNLQAGTACLNALTDVTIDTDNTCITYNATNSANISLMIRRGTDKSIILDSVIVQAIDSTGSSKPTSVKIDGNLTLGGTWSYEVIGVSNDTKKITIAPVVRVGNSIKQCDASTSPITLVECSSK